MNVIIGLLIVACIAMLGASAIAGYKENEQWIEYRASHECKRVGVIKGEVFNTIGVGANGQMAVGVGSTSDKEGWACNDGVTYWR